MRVITGSARGRNLETLEGLDVRPTTDRVKEAMFSILHFALPGATVLDLFAGSGQLGIEALSRGANLCVFVDQSPKAHEVQKRNLQATGLMPKARVIRGDYRGFLAGAKDQYDIVLLDPPYDADLVPQALELLSGKLRSGGIILCETDLAHLPPAHCGVFARQKVHRFGKIAVSRYETTTPIE